MNKTSKYSHYFIYEVNKNILYEYDGILEQ